MSELVYVDKLSTTGVISVVNGLGASRDLDWSFRFDGMGSTRTVPRFTVSGGVGGRKTSPTTINERVLTLVGVVSKPTVVEAVSEVDSLEAFLSIPPLQVFVRGKYLDCELLDFTRPAWITEKVSEVRVELLAAHPMWLAETLTEPSVALGSTSGSLSVPNNGSYTVEPIITVTVTAATTATYLSITNDTNSLAVTITDSFTNGDVYELDCATMMITKNGVRTLSLVDDAFLLSGFSLNAGVNELSLSSDNAFNGSVTVSFRERFFNP